MSKGYWIVSLTITDNESYQRYVAANAVIFERWGGRFIVRGGEFEVVQGASAARQVVLEFGSFAAAKDCYSSPEYQQALKDLLAGANLQFLIVEGV